MNDSVLSGADLIFVEYMLKIKKNEEIHVEKQEKGRSSFAPWPDNPGEDICKYPAPEKLLGS
jgi:hypothetical protein